MGKEKSLKMSDKKKKEYVDRYCVTKKINIERIAEKKDIWRKVKVGRKIHSILEETLDEKVAREKYAWKLYEPTGHMDI